MGFGVCFGLSCVVLLVGWVWLRVCLELVWGVVYLFRLCWWFCLVCLFVCGCVCVGLVLVVLLDVLDLGLYLLNGWVVFWLFVGGFVVCLFCWILYGCWCRYYGCCCFVGVGLSWLFAFGVLVCGWAC